MSVRVTPAEPAAGPVALAAGGAGVRPARPGVRWVAWVLGGAAILAAVVLIACELAAAHHTPGVQPPDQLQAGRITLVNPDIDLGAGAGVAGAPATGAGREPLLSAGARLLSRWRGGRIDIQG